MTRNLASGLVKLGHNVTITGFITGYENWNGINVLPLSTPFTHPHDQFIKNLNSYKAEALICIHEAHGDYNDYSKIFSPTFFWVPVEGVGIPQKMAKDLKATTINVISQSYVGKKELDASGVKCEVIYPGYDPEIFTDKPEHQCKFSIDLYQHTQSTKFLLDNGCWQCCGTKYDCKYFEPEKINIKTNGSEYPGTPASLDSLKDNLGVDIVIGCVAQNMGLRKRFERLIESFSIMENKTDTILHLHTLPDCPIGINLIEVARKYEVLDKIVFSYSSNPVYGISDYGLNYLYNYFDIHATASGAEGFCLPVLESMAIGKPQIAPHFSTFPELIGNDERGLLASVAATHMIENGSLRCLVSVNSMASCMDELRCDKNLRSRLESAGKEWAKQYTWDKEVEQWDKVLTETIDSKKQLKTPMGVII